MENKEKSLRKKKKRGKWGFVGFILLAFAFSIVANLVLTYGDRLETMIVREGSSEESIKTEGFIFRNQTVIYAPQGGYLYCTADEDERVKMGKTVAYIYKNEINVSANSELKNIEQQIEKLTAGVKKTESYRNDTAKIEQSISHELRSVAKSGYENQVEAVAQIRDEVDKLINDRRVITGEAEPEDKQAEIDALERKKDELEKEYNIERVAVHAPEAGAFSARVDGLEGRLGLDAVKDVDMTLLRELGKLVKEAEVSTKVGEGEAIGKIVDNFEWCVAAPVSVDDAEDIRKGDSISIRFTDINVDTVDGTVTSVTPEEGGKVIVVVKSNQYMDRIYSSSQVKIEFVKNRYSGLKIPSRAIRILDGKTGVYAIRNNQAKFLQVEVLFNDKEWVIVSERASDGTELKLYDELIVKGKNLYDNKVVR